MCMGVCVGGDIPKDCALVIDNFRWVLLVSLLAVLCCSTRPDHAVASSSIPLTCLPVFCSLLVRMLSQAWWCCCVDQPGAV